ncbi:MAG: monovalent cation/H(+) antiporter subunit G [Deltaproteobacteria bacterium]|nr:monovalent cation/H(+) antiporter subunit G [Deltaproteobacteria bacterium]
METFTAVLGVAGGVIAVIGALFLFLGALGIYRMPDVYNRLHAGTKATTLGNILTLVGFGLTHPEWLPKIALVVLFVILTNPLSSHALARAAIRSGVRPVAGTTSDEDCALTGGQKP